MFTFIANNALLILGILSVIFLLIYGAYKIITGSTGSWSSKLSTQLPPSAAIIQTSKTSDGEARARSFLETYFNKPFPKARPYFLNNEVTGGKYNLEIDCFNDELKLGIEYNGKQHYEYTPFFHSSREAFYNQKYRDKLKQIYCRDRGVDLIEIPYTETKNLEGWLEKTLLARGYARDP